MREASAEHPCAESSVIRVGAVSIKEGADDNSHKPITRGRRMRTFRLAEFRGLPRVAHQSRVRKVGCGIDGTLEL